MNKDLGVIALAGRRGLSQWRENALECGMFQESWGIPELGGVDRVGTEPF